MHPAVSPGVKPGWRVFAALSILSLISMLTFAHAVLASDDPSVVQLQNTTADAGSAEDCGDVAAGTTLFHFVANNLAVDSTLLDFSADFDPATTFTFDARIINSTVTHIDVVVDGDPTLLDASASFDLAQASGPSGAKLVLSHICATSDQEEPPPNEGTPDVTVAKAASVPNADVGDSFEYTLVVHNVGTATASGVQLKDPTLDAEMTISSVVASQGSCTITNNDLACNLGDLPAAASATVTFTATVHQDACPSLRNTARVSAANEPLENAANNTSDEVLVLINGCHSLAGSIKLLKVDENGSPLPGAVFTVEGQEGTFVTGSDGTFCVTGLPVFTDFMVTEIQAPQGFAIGDTPSQSVRDDHDGDCDSPEVTFVNHRAGTQGGGGGPKPKPTHEGTKAGQGGPGTLPNTATPGGERLPVGLISLVLLSSLAVLGGFNLAVVRNRRQ